MRVFPLGNSAATIEFGNEISAEINRRSIDLVHSLSSAPIAGMIEAVPAYASVTVFYDNRTNFETVKTELKKRSASPSHVGLEIPTLVEIPMVITPETAPDLDRVVGYASISLDDAIELFLSKIYSVYMLGFLPGFAYMGEVDDRIAAPRLETPRTKVPQGSVGIAGKQTGIYPLESPGGWNIIGRTDLRMFDPISNDPCLLKPGDEVRFVRC